MLKKLSLIAIAFTSLNIAFADSSIEQDCRNKAENFLAKEKSENSKVKIQSNKVLVCAHTSESGKVYNRCMVYANATGEAKVEANRQVDGVVGGEDIVKYKMKFVAEMFDEGGVEVYRPSDTIGYPISYYFKQTFASREYCPAERRRNCTQDKMDMSSMTLVQEKRRQINFPDEDTIYKCSEI